jgi:hypothetical protein
MLAPLQVQYEVHTTLWNYVDHGNATEERILHLVIVIVIDVTPMSVANNCTLKDHDVVELHGSDIEARKTCIKGAAYMKT